MGTITGTLKGCTLLNKAFGGAGTTTRDLTETWLMEYDFTAYTGASDDAKVAAVGAAITARVRDGKTRTLLMGGPAGCGADTANQAVALCGTSVAALTISTDDLTGELCSINTVSTEVTSTTGVTSGVPIVVVVAVT